MVSSPASACFMETFGCVINLYSQFRILRMWCVSLSCARIPFSLSTQTQVLICPNWWFLYEWDLACNFLNERSRTRVIRIFKNFIFNCPWCGTPCLFSGHNSVYELATLCVFLPSLFPALSHFTRCQHVHRWSGRRHKTSQLLKIVI